MKYFCLIQNDERIDVAIKRSERESQIAFRTNIRIIEINDERFIQSIFYCIS